MKQMPHTIKKQRFDSLNTFSFQPFTTPCITPKKKADRQVTIEWHLLKYAGDAFVNPYKTTLSS